MVFLQAVAQIDWTPYVLSALGGLVMLLGWNTIIDLKERVKALEKENIKQADDRVKRNELIAKEISDWKLETKDDLNDIAKSINRILPNEKA